MADTKAKANPLQATEAKGDEATRLASLAGVSADTKQPTKPSSLSGGALEEFPAAVGNSGQPLVSPKEAPNGDGKFSYSFSLAS